MSTNRKNDMMVYCSFCGKSQEEVKKIIKFEMENAVKLDVPLIAEVSEAKNWYECK